MKVKVAEASGVVLDYMVALALGHNIVWDGIAYWVSDLNTSKLIGPDWKAGGRPCGWSPSTYGNDGMPIIDRLGGFQLKNWPESEPSSRCEAHIHNYEGDWIAFGPTALISALRCFVMSELGDEVEVPAGLLS